MSAGDSPVSEAMFAMKTLIAVMKPARLALKSRRLVSTSSRSEPVSGSSRRAKSPAWCIAATTRSALPGQRR